MHRTLLVASWLVLFFTGCGAVDTTVASGVDAATCTDTWSGYGESFFSSTCSSCHEHGNDFTSQLAVQADRSQIRSQISSGRMPEGTTLSSTAKARILLYLDCGAP